MAQQDIRYYLNGLLMVVEDDQLKLVATDGHRLAYASRKVGGKNLSRQEVILPRKTIIELSKLLDDSDDPVAIDLSAAQAKFKFGNVVLSPSWSMENFRTTAASYPRASQEAEARPDRPAAGRCNAPRY